jgi:hypothetical protein
MKIEAFFYFPTPKGYECGVCHMSGVKLWRVAASSHIELFCADCACKESGENVQIDADGRHESKYGPTDQLYSVGHTNLVPAIPTEDGQEWWGYTSVPEPGVRWWRRLPTYREQV